MQQNIEEYISQLITQDEAAQLKGWPVSTFKLRASRLDAPKAIHIRRHVFYNRADIEGWNPATQPKGRKKK